MKHLFTLVFCCAFLIPAIAQNTPKREFRGAWIATYANIDWPNRTQTPQQQRAAFIAIVDHHKATGMNALFIQIRSQCDALYPSSIEPWSADLTGTQGVGSNPAWDPMQFMIDECHKRGIEFHAWLNPYRAVANFNQIGSFAASHVARQHPEWLLSQGNLRVLDPGLPVVRDYIASVILDILNRYDVDGIHFDDYFYPAPQTGITPFNDDASFNADSRGFTNRGDWRRDNVNLLIKRTYDSVKNIKPWVKFGVSPSGIWRNASSDPVNGSATSGLEHYSALYADSRKWLQQGWVDYIAPQIYWYIGQPGSNYSVLIPWWNSNGNSRHIYSGMAGYKVNDPAQGVNWANPSQIPNQVRLNRNMLYSSIYGQSIYNTSSLRNTTKLGFRDSLRLFFYHKPALLPSMPWRDSVPPEAPSSLRAIKYNNDSIVLSWTRPPTTIHELDKAKRFVIYRSNTPAIDITNGNNIIAITNIDTATFVDRSLLGDTSYYYTITAIDRFHNESIPSNISDYTAPTIICPGNQELNVQTSCAAALPDYRSLVTVSDDVSLPDNISITQTPAPGTVVNGTGNLTVNIIATDVANNTASCSFTVTTTDKKLPVITPVNSSITNGGTITIPTDTGRCSFEADHQLDITAIDNCDTSLSYLYTLTHNGITSQPVTASSLAGVLFSKGTTLISWLVTDDAGNTATYSYVANIVDQEAPVITGVYANPAILTPPDHKMRNVKIFYEVADNCGPVTNILSVVSNKPVNNNKNPDWIIIDDHNLQLRAERSGTGEDRQYTIKITSTDFAGNVSTQTVIVVVPQNSTNSLQFEAKKENTEKIESALTVKALQNPTTKQFSVITKSESLEPLNIVVTDNTGRVMETRSGVTANSMIQIGSNYPSGIYYIEVKQEKKQQTIKLVKQKG